MRVLNHKAMGKAEVGQVGSMVEAVEHHMAIIREFVERGQRCDMEQAGMRAKAALADLGTLVADIAAAEALLAAAEELDAEQALPTEVREVA